MNFGISDDPRPVERFWVDVCRGTPIGAIHQTIAAGRLMPASAAQHRSSRLTGR